MDDMGRAMGPYTPRELYPSLMQLPDLSPEKREEIEDEGCGNISAVISL